MRPLSDKEADVVLDALGATHAPVRRAGVRVAMTFFARYQPQLDLQKQYSYLKAMDLSKPVAIVDLLPGTRVAAFRHHSADFGEFHSRAGTDPSRLGILLGGRQYRLFEVVQRVAALSSYTASFRHSALGSGGAEQLIIPNAPVVLRVVQRGITTR